MSSSEAEMFHEFNVVLLLRGAILSSCWCIDQPHPDQQELKHPHTTVTPVTCMNENAHTSSHMLLTPRPHQTNFIQPVNNLLKLLEHGGK